MVRVLGIVQREIKETTGVSGLKKLRMSLTLARIMGYTLSDILLLLSCTGSLGKNIPKAKPMIG